MNSEQNGWKNTKFKYYVFPIDVSIEIFTEPALILIMLCKISSEVPDGISFFDPKLRTSAPFPTALALLAGGPPSPKGTAIARIRLVRSIDKGNCDKPSPSGKGARNERNAMK